LIFYLGNRCWNFFLWFGQYLV